MFPFIAPILAQIREDTEVMLASSLEVFAGSGTPEENLYVGITVIAGGLIAVLLAINITVLLQKVTVTVLVKVFTMWLIFAAGVSAIAIPNYIAQKQQYVPTQADVTAQPTDITVKLDDQNITITWQTVAATYGYVKYRTDLTSEPIVASETKLEARTSHEVIIPRTVYQDYFEFVIISEGYEYRLDDQWIPL